MRLSAKTEYAAIAILELARNWGSEEPVRIRSIAAAHGVPSRFLVQILLQLKGAGVVTSTRGAAGGYQLARSPAEITLDDIFRVIEGPDELVTAVTAGLAGKSRSVAVLLDSWRSVAAAETEALRGVTFAELVERSRSATDPMYYI
ncbi:MAG: Rrf2 family transcriptional regulator [Planctomycetota bacterium]|nr:MAG: Rrf2 family transcriptional regulator [Planctomycetota bacterium]